MKTITHIASRVWIAVAALVAASVVPPARAVIVTKANNANALNLGTSWSLGVAPGSGDVASWDATSGFSTVSLGADLSWQGMKVLADPGGNLVFSTGNTLTLGAAGFESTPNRSVSFNNAILLGADQTWSMAQNYVIPLGTVNTAGYTLTLAGGGIKQFKNSITGGGDLVVAGGTLQMTSPTGFFAAAPGSAFTLKPGTTLWFDVKRGNSNVRAASVDVVGGTLQTKGDTLSGGVAQKDFISGDLTVSAGAIVQVQTGNASSYAQLFANRLVRGTHPSILFRGTNLGSNTIASISANTASIAFTNAPALVGGGGAAGTSTVDILPGAYGDLVYNGSGTSLVTYDTTYGVRLLNAATEYTATLVDGQTQLDNVRLANTSGSGIATTTLTQDTVINSLTFSETGVGTNTGIRLVGDVPTRQLTLNSGMVLGRQAVTSAVSSDAMVITNLTLNLNGQEGVFVAFTAGIDQGNTPGALYIYAAITNDAGKGVTIAGSGETFFAGTTTNTYTGLTTVNSGILRLAKSPSSIGIPGDLVMNGGILLKNSEAIPNTSDVTLNGGAFYFDFTRSSGNDGHTETLRNLTMNGGTINHNSGSDAVFNINGDATVNAADLRMNAGGDVTVLGTTTLSGGRLVVSASSGAVNTNALFTLNDLFVVNTRNFSPVYTSVVFNAHATNRGGRLLLKGNVSATGDALNTNPIVFGSSNSALANQGFIALDGNRTFDIGDGAGGVDLAVLPVMANNGATVGGLVKTGAGTLALNGTNTFTGGTAVNVGTLAGTGVLASDVSVAANAALAPGTPGTVGTLTVNANVAFANGSALKVDTLGATSDLLAVSGAVTGSGTVSVVPTVDGVNEWKVLTASSIAPTFVSTLPSWSLVKRAGGTELWLTKTSATLILIR